jgi:DHA1 family bicyclomycin/chloramphenicol resistance-like MFS transporter
MLVFGAAAVALIGATQANPRLLRRWSPQAVVLGASVAGTAAAAVLLLLAVTGAGGLFGLLLPLWAVLACIGLVMPNAPALALSRHGSAAGTAAAMLGAVQFGVGALAAPVVGALGSDRVAMAVVVLGGTASALAVLLAVVRPWRLPAR